MQQSLFNWDRVETGVAWRSLAMLDFRDARHRFDHVMKCFPGHTEAAAGMPTLEYWQKTLAEAEGLEPEAALRFLWHNLRHFSFKHNEQSRNLRTTLSHRLLADLAGRPSFYDPPDLCNGYLHLQLGNLAAAEIDLRALIDLQPNNGMLHLYLGETLYRQDRHELSGACYAIALLLAPHEVSQQPILHQPLAELVRAHGPILAPLYAFLQGILPLVAYEPQPDSTETRIYLALLHAEQARRDGQHQEMVAARRELRNLSAEIFQEYLDTLHG